MEGRLDWSPGEPLLWDMVSSGSLLEITLQTVEPAQLLPIEIAWRGNSKGIDRAEVQTQDPTLMNLPMSVKQSETL